MAGGRGILDSNGKLLIRSDGTVDVCEDCCNVYSRWRKCGSLTGEIYTRDSDSAPNPFKRISDGTCWSRVSTGQALPGGATLLDPGDWTTDARCCVCSNCDDALMPISATVVVSGVTFLTDACMTTQDWLQNGSSKRSMYIDAPAVDPNGTYNLTFSGCSAVSGASGSIVRGCDDVGCVGFGGTACSGTGQSIRVSVGKSAGAWSASVSDGYFSGDAVVVDPYDCDAITSFVVSNNFIDGPWWRNPLTGIASVGWGGTISVTLNW